MNSKIEKDLRAVFEAGKKCMQDHPDDDTYDQVRFEQAVKEFEKSLKKRGSKQAESSK